MHTENYFTTMPSPVGRLTLIASDKGLAAVLWENDDPDRVAIDHGNESEDHPVLQQAVQQLKEYFALQRDTFSVALDFNGTDFQKKVWNALLTIPFGETRTYGDIAAQIGSVHAVRAVGGAANKNPISIIAPCHRVVGADGKLVGFAGGLEHKTKLLQIEGNPTQTTLW